MDAARRRALAEQALDGYPHGLAAAADATRAAVERLDDPSAVFVVEGVSDQIAVETLARRLGVDLAASRAAVIPIGGAHALARGVAAIAAQWPDARVGGMYDAAEEPVVRAGLARYGVGVASDRTDLERLGFWVCDPDLEHELVRALGVEGTVRCIREQGDLGSLRSLQRQPAWRDRALPDQLRRFFSSVAHRNMRYARVLTTQIPIQRMPRALSAAVAVLAQA